MQGHDRACGLWLQLANLPNGADDLLRELLARLDQLGLRATSRAALLRLRLPLPRQPLRLGDLVAGHTFGDGITSV